MTDLAQMPTQIDAEVVGAHLLSDIHRLLESQQKQLAAQQQEIERLTAQLLDLRAGRGISLVVDGCSFSLQVDGPTTFSASDLIDPGVRDEVSQRLVAVFPPGRRNPLDDSFVL